MNKKINKPELFEFFPKITPSLSKPKMIMNRTKIAIEWHKRSNIKLAIQKVIGDILVIN